MFQQVRFLSIVLALAASAFSGCALEFNSLKDKLGALNNPNYATALGVLDTSFNSSGYFRYNMTLEYHHSCVKSVFPQADGTTLMLTVRGDNRPILMKLNVSGNLDTSFASVGYTQIQNGSMECDTTEDNPGNLAIQPDGKIVYTGNYITSFGIWRYNADGTPDASFGTAGFATVDGPTTWEYSRGIRILSNSKILAGAISHGGPPTIPMLVQLNSNGSVDSSFGTAGVRILDLPALATTAFGGTWGVSQIYDVEEDFGGKIYAVAGIQNTSSTPVWETIVARLNTDGTMDASYGTNGLFRLPFTGYGGVDAAPTKMVRHGSNFFILGRVGSTQQNYLYRLTSAGAVDTAWATNGYSIIASPTAWFSVQPHTNLVFDSSNRMYFGGSNLNDNTAWVSRMTAAGVVDTTFGSSGYLMMTSAISDNRARGIGIDTSDRLIIGSGGKTDTLWSDGTTLLNDIIVLRTTDLNASALDSSWGNHSGYFKFSIPYVDSNENRIFGLHETASGTVIAGNMDRSGTDMGFVIRLDSSYALDPSFSSDGKLDWGFPSMSLDEFYSFNVLQNGMYLLGGMGFVSLQRRIAFTQFDTSGAADAGFGTAGSTSINLPSSQERAYHIEQQSTGLTIVGVQTPTDFSVARITSTGTLDTTFGASGVRLIDTGSSETISDLIVLADDSIVAVGYDGTKIIVAKVTASGALDASFATTGIFTYSSGNGNDLSGEVLEDGNNLVVVGGTGDGWSFGQYTILRMNKTTGALDTTFNPGGATPGVLQLNDADAWPVDAAHRIKKDAAGNYVIAGVSGDGFGTDYLSFLRVTPDGGIDATFGTSGYLVDIFPGVTTQNVGPFLIQSDGKILATSSTWNDAVLLRIR